MLVIPTYTICNTSTTYNINITNITYNDGNFVIYNSKIPVLPITIILTINHYIIFIIITTHGTILY